MPSPNEIAQCKKKVRFANDVAAQSALKKINPGKSSARKPSRVYKCPVCSGFHLSSQPKR